jgi:ABC-2 type transport system ATP-binding protein
MLKEREMIQVEHLTKYYDDICAVDGIGFTIRSGEIIGLLGPNGAGKTTTMRMLTGFLTPSNGTIRVKDFDIAENPLEIKKLLGYLPESAPLYHDMIVYDYLDYVADIRGLKGQVKMNRIRTLADLCGLDPVMHKTIGVLSKGFRQRVGLAHAMMSDPEILILDEPTSGLDPNQIVEIREIIKKIGKEKTVILSTHILSEAEATCDRVLIINKGKIAADGNLNDLKRSAGGKRVIHLTVLGAGSAALKERLAGIPGIEDSAVVEQTTESVRMRLTADTDTDPRSDIYRTIRETEWILVELHQEVESLESVFRELTKEG